MEQPELSLHLWIGSHHRAPQVEDTPFSLEVSLAAVERPAIAQRIDESSGYTFGAKVTAALIFTGAAALLERNTSFSNEDAICGWKHC